MSTQNKTIISWQAPEYRHYEKSSGWYVALAAIAILVTGFFVIVQKDYFAAATLALIAVFIYLFSLKKPELVNIELSDKGVRFGNLVFPYKQIKHFWVVQNEHHKTLNLHTNTLVNNIIILELQDQDPEMIRTFLLGYLPEHAETLPTFAQRISHKLKF